MAEVRQTLNERGTSHGDYSLDAEIGIRTLELWCKVGWQDLSNVQKHALSMIAFKVARILAGDANFKDHWHDIAGYATLAEDRCQ